MSKLQLLTQSQQTKFDSCPNFTNKKRLLYFSINDEIEEYIANMRNPINKVGFLLQVGYFRAAGKFFANDLFRKSDIEYVCNLLELDLSDLNIDFKKYISKSRALHKNYILEISGWQHFTSKHVTDLHAELSLHAKQQMHPKLLLPIATEYLIKRKIELPLYYVLVDIITDVYNKIEYTLVDIIDKCLSQNQKEVLDDLIWFDRKSSKNYKYSALSRVKQFSFSTKIINIQDSIENYKLLKVFYSEFKGTYNKLELSENATSYYSEWVRRSKLFQLKQFKNRSKAYLYLLAHLKHQYFRQTDLYTDVFLKLVRTANNAANKKIEKRNATILREQKNALKKLTTSYKSSKQGFMDIVNVCENQDIKSSAKVDEARRLALNYLNGEEYTQIENDRTISLLDNNYADNKLKSELLRSIGASLQRKLTPIICELDFENMGTKNKIYDVIQDFAESQGKVDKNVDCAFLNDQETLLISDKKTVNALAYKAALFSKTYDAIKSGELNLRNSYKYLSLRNYLINDSRWDKHSETIISACGLRSFSSFDKVICSLNEVLNKRYEHVNTEYKNGNNKYLTFNKEGNFIIATPKAKDEKPKSKLAPIFAKEGIVPIPRVLNEVNNAAGFTKCFKHHSNKNVVMKPSPEMIFAGILSKGCNHGTMKMANISKGITEDKLNNTVNWFFSLENIQDANNAVIEYINKLSLPNIYKLGDNYSHTSSDGQKFNVGVDSILSNYSFKYFGQAQGISVYSFIDDRQVLFYNTVISPGEREAAFVIDGLMSNSIVKSFIHSTDTHGYSEVIFAVMHLLGISFAPRIKKLGAQKLYCIDSKRKYNKNDYQIKFDSKINLKLIASNWDNMLRLVSTIKTKTFTASQIFKRLNSYTKELPLYRALKEFGRILKTIYILTYIEDPLLRQQIEKQLNKIESSHKFGRAVFFANSQEFRVGSTEEQMLIVACRSFIQNCIVLWNYLYLSQVLLDQESDDRKLLLQTIKDGSVISWRHINLHGEYDFTVANDQGASVVFDLDKIKRLKVS